MPKNSRSNRTSFEGQDHRVCAERGVEHRLAKPYHPWTNGLAERMVRTIKDATVRAFHYAASTI